MNAEGAANDARTGANIRGSSMAAVVCGLRGSFYHLETFRHVKWSVRWLQQPSGVEMHLEF